MKYKFLIFSFLLFVFNVFPFVVNAAGEAYEAGIKYYSVGDNFDPYYTEDWLNQFQDGTISELTETTLNPGDTFVVAVTLKTIDSSNANSMAFALYYRYNADLIQIADVDAAALFDKRIVSRGGIFPVSSWNYDVLNTDNPGEISITFRDTKTASPTVFTNTEEGPAAFVFFTVKDDATPGEALEFTWITESNNTDGLYTMGSTADSQSVAVKTVDSSTLSIYDESAGDTTLSSLTVSNSSTNYLLEPEFIAGSSTTSYSTIVPAHIDKATINATATAGNILPGGLGEKALNVGDNHFEFTVTASDGSTEIYSVDIKRLSNVATLNELSLSGVTLNEAFNSNVFNYTANVSYKTTSTTVSATPTTPATIKNEIGEVNFTNVGLNTINVVVEAENCKAEYASVIGNTCTSNTYKLDVTRANASSIATLSKITVEGVAIPSFDANTFEYTLDPVNPDLTSLNVVPTLSDPNATYVVNGADVLKIGDNAITIVVTAEDNITTNTYTLNVRRKSKDATLKSLSVTSDPQGSLSPKFESQSNDYTYTYDDGVTTIDIDAISSDEHAKVEIDQNDTRAVITVTAEAGNANVYVVQLERRKSTVSTLKSLEVKNGDISYLLDPVFSEDEREYSVTVPNEVSQVTIEAEATSEYAQDITGLGEVTLQVGENPKEVEVTAEDVVSKTKYILNITREQSSNAYLTDIKVDGVSITGFDKDTFNYTLDAVSNATSSLNLTYTQENPDSTVEILDNALVEGQDNVVKIKVTSQDKSQENEYLLTVRRKSSNANLTNIIVSSTPQGTLSPAFDANETNYTYYYDRSVETINIEVEKAYSEALVTGDREYQVATEKTATITVTPEDGNIKTYNISFKQNLEKDSTLKRLEVKNGAISYPLDPVFSKDELEYNVTIPNEVSKVTIEAEATSEYAQDITGLGEVTLQIGTNREEVEVTAEDGSTTTYVLTINRAVNTDASLTSLKVDNVEVPNFRVDQTEYTLDSVDFDKDSVEISATEPEGATVSGTGNKDLNVGANKFEVEVTAQDGINKTTYIINIHRKNNDASLENLVVNSVPDGILNPAFDKNTKDYILNIPANVDTITVVATPARGATVTNQDDLSDILVDDTPKVTILVTAEDSNYTDEYTITIQKEKDTNADLSSLIVSEGELNPTFSASVNKYTVDVDSTVNSIEIEATADDPKASVSGDLGPQNLEYGENVFNIKVTAEDGVTTKNYSITVTRKKRNDTSLNDLRVDGITVDGFDSDIDSYEVEVENEVSSITLLATPSDNEAVIDEDLLGIKELTVGDNLFSIVVTAHDGVSTKIYNINIIRKSSSDKNITSLTVFGKNAVWNDDLSKFEVDVDYENDSLTPDDIEAIIPQNASIDKGVGMSLLPGINSYIITIIAEDKTEKEYTVEINRNLNGDNKLMNLTVYGKTPFFNGDDNRYELEVENNIDTLTPDDIEATVPDGASLDKGAGTNLVVGDNNYSITVTAANGSVEIYNIVISRKNPDLSSDNDLIDLEVVGYTLTPVFDKNILSYSIGTLAYDVDELTINATTSDDNDNINYYVNDALQENNNVSLPLVEGNATIKVEIVAEDNSKKAYLINYEKAKEISGKITSTVHTITGNNIMTVKLNTTGIEMKNQLDNPNEYLEIWSSDDSRQIEDGETLATGMIVKLMINGIERDRKYIIIKGDTNGDGLIDLFDAVKILNHYLDRTPLTGPYLESAYANEDSDVDLFDAVKILNHYLEKSFIH